MTTQRKRIPAIPTTYNSTNFRSMLEAHWAAFFDLIEWQWLYEPHEFNGWIPDFLINGLKPFYIEIKPCLNTKDLIDQCKNKINRSGVNQTVVLLGVDPEVVAVGLRHLGTEFLTSEKVWKTRWNYLHPPNQRFWRICTGCGGKVRMDNHNLFERVMSPCRCTYGIPNSSNPIIEWDSAYRQQLWREAGNQVQWRKP